MLKHITRENEVCNVNISGNHSLLAGPVGQAALVHVLQHSAVRPAVAGARDVGGAIEQNLYGGQEVANGIVLHELETVGDGGNSAVSPAGAAVLRDVLVEVGGAVVDAADVAPGEVGGNICTFDVVFGLGRGDDLEWTEASMKNRFKR
jgi:hypothetical protein